MADWIEQYTAALAVRDERESLHKPYIDAYTKLADRTARLDSQSSTAAITSPASHTTTGQTTIPRALTPTKGKQASATSSTTPPPPSAPSPDPLARLRLDLASTQQSRAQLSTQLTSLTTQLTTATTAATASTQRIAALEREKRDAERRLRDRDEELRGKARLVEGVQDELVGLNLQLNMAEQRAERLAGENAELVRRWMERMGREAERMNEASEWR